MSETRSHLGLYRASLTSPEHRRHITVARREIVADTLEILRGSASRRSKHHFLFIGPRGVGKTHLLHLVSDEIARQSELAARYVLARFPEEANRVLSFADFLLRLCEILREALPDEPDWAELYEQLHTEEDDSLIVDRLVPFIRKSNRGKTRTILVMLENLSELFNRQIKSKKDLAALRKFFMGDNGCLLMATAPLHFDAITNVTEPFFDFFDVQILDNLGEQETLELIRLNLEWDQRQDLLDSFDDLRPKLLALCRMTGGNPRLSIMLYELIAHDSITKVQEQFQILLDRISPFYQDRLNDLAPQERAVLETLAAMRDRDKTPTAIAAQMRMSQAQTSTLLKRLAAARYIRSSPHPRDKRRRLYTIREGFLDIWLGMNVSRGSRDRIPYLVDFFAIFYPSLEERNRKRAELREKLRAEAGRDDAEQILDHLSEVGRSDEKARAKLDLAAMYATADVGDRAFRYIAEAQRLSLDPVGRWIVEHAAASTDYLAEVEEMIECWEQHRSGDLEAFAQRLIELGGSISYKSFSATRLAFLLDHLAAVGKPDERIGLRLQVASVLRIMARWKEAEEQLRAAESELPERSPLQSVVYNNLAELLQATNRLEEAEQLLRRALEIDPSSAATYVGNLASVLKATNRLEEAESLIRRALEIQVANFGSNHPHVVSHLNNLALLLQTTDRLDEAESLMRHGLEIGESSFGGDHPQVATLLNNLALLLHATNRSEEAEPLMRRILEIDEAAFGTDHPDVARDLNNLALLLQTTNRPEEAEPLMHRVLAIKEASFGGDHPSVATALHNLAILFTNTHRLEEAEPLMRRAVECFAALTRGTGYSHPLSNMVFGNYRSLLRDLGRSEQEIATTLLEIMPLRGASG